MNYNVDVKGGSSIKFWIGELYDSEDEKAEKELAERGLTDEELEAIKAGQVYNMEGAVQ